MLLVCHENRDKSNMCVFTRKVGFVSQHCTYMMIVVEWVCVNTCTCVRGSHIEKLQTRGQKVGGCMG